MRGAPGRTARRQQMPYKSDQDLARDVREEIDFDPAAVVRDLDIAVTDGEVTLSGIADTPGRMWHAERAASRVRGVRAVINEIVVAPPEDRIPDDRHLAEAV